MLHTYAYQRRPSHSPESEERLLSFAERIENRDQRSKDVLAKINEEMDTRKKAGVDIAGRMGSNQASRPEVDPNRAQSRFSSERYSLLMKDAPKTPKYQGAIEKAMQLEQQYATRQNLEGITFGLRGGDFTVIGGDEEFIGAAINFVATQVKELQVQPKPLGGSKALDAYTAQFVSAGSETNAQHIEQWGMVSKALSLYNSNIEKTQQYTRDLARDPQSINNIPSKWIRDNTPQYKEFLRNAAKTDPSVLVGKELTILKIICRWLRKPLQKIRWLFNIFQMWRKRKTEERNTEHS
jgi:hypothetical protein